MIRFSGIGRLGSDPTTKRLEGGQSVTEFSAAFAGRKKDDPATWVQCAAFGKTGEAIAQWFAKGKPIFIAQADLWEEKYEKEGVKKSALKANVNAWEFCPKYEPEGQPQAQETTAKPAASNAAETTDDLPF